jgi:hypothetical protein
LQAIAAVVRGYLMKNAVWINGLKMEFAFAEIAVNDEPYNASFTNRAAVLRLTNVSMELILDEETRCMPWKRSSALCSRLWAILKTRLMA